MKKYITGIALIVLAGLLLFQDVLLPLGFPLPLWSLVGMLTLAAFTVSSAVKGHLSSSFIAGTILLIWLNHYYAFLSASPWTIALASFLVLIALKGMFQSKWRKRDNKADKQSAVAFGTGNRYIYDDDFTHDSMEVAFGSANVYFSNAVILGDVATFKVEAAFANVVLYVPSNWYVDTQGDNVFSSINNRTSVNKSSDKILRVSADLAFSTLTIKSL